MTHSMEREVFACLYRLRFSHRLFVILLFVPMILLPKHFARVRTFTRIWNVWLVHILSQALIESVIERSKFGAHNQYYGPHDVRTSLEMNVFWYSQQTGKPIHLHLHWIPSTIFLKLLTKNLRLSFARHWFRCSYPTRRELVAVRILRRSRCSDGSKRKSIRTWINANNNFRHPLGSLLEFIPIIKSIR